MLTSLDPHSGYLSPDDAAEMRVETRGEFGGLGIEVTQEEGWVKVVSPMDGTPAEAAGIMAGDFITAVNGESVMGLTLDDAVDLMRGPVGSEIIVTIVREGTPEPFEVSIIRDTIKLTAVRARTEGRAVVLRITTFNDQTFPDLSAGLAEQVEAAGGLENVNGIVLDLRNNPAGCSTRPSMSPTPSSTRARSSPPVAATPRWATATTPPPATLSKVCPSSSSSTAARPRHRKSSRARCRTTAAPSSWAPSPSARGPSRPSCRCKATARCA